MKVTVTFGQTSVVVPCKEGWKVRELIQQATQRYRKLLEQEGNFLVRTHHVEYCDGGILDPDDVLTDLVEDRDKLMAVYEEQEAQRRGAVSPRGGVTGRPSQDPYDAEVSVFQPIRGGEIEVNSSALQSNTPLLVRSSSESTLSPLVEMLQPTQPQEPNDRPGPEPPTGVNHGLEKTGGHRADVSTTKLNTFSLSSLTKTVEISGEHGPLGIHVVPYVSSLSGRALGLHIRGVEENSRSKREGIFQDDECIVKINETELMDKSFTQAQEVFRYAMRSPMVRLEVVPVSNRERYEKSLIGQLFNQSGSPKATLKTSSKEPPSIKPAVKPYDSPTARMAEDSISLEGRPMGSPHLAHPVPVSLSPVPKEKSDSPLLKRSPTFSTLVGFTSKKGGKRLKIDLKKGPEGLGFTVVTRDSSVHGPGPILVKNILPRGAAVKDGRLQSGDRILEVNGVDISRRSQEDLVSMLRSTRQGESVVLLVARQEDVFLPRELKEEEARAVLLSEEGKEQLMFEVPLNDTGSAGLGISLKGNKSRETGEDLGIFIKSIIHGGAAYKDGHLRGNDQLIAVNGESLLGKSNHEAMETLRRSMSMEGNLRGMIQLVVLRALVKSEDPFVPSNQSFDASISCPARSANTSAQQPVVNNTIYERSNVFNGSSVHVGEEDDEEEFDWQVEQEVYVDTSEEQLNELQKYGFGSQRSGVFTRLQEELSDVIDIRNPDGTTASERRRKRLDAETSIFCTDHYLADLFEDEQIQGLLKFRPWWSDLCPDSIRQGEAAVSFTDDEKEQLRKFTNHSYILDKKSRFQVWLSLVDIILAYCYELRTTEGEHNVESPWTIRKLSGTLCWLETYSSLQEVLVSFGRRVLCYPLYRHFSLVSAAVQDAARIFQSGKVCVLKCLLDIHKVFRENEPAYILNDLYITDYCVWIQRVKSRKVTALADPLRKVSLRKGDLELELEVLETAAMLVEEEEKVEDGGKSPSRTPLSHSGEESDSDDSSSDSSEESEDSEAEGKDCADRTEGGGERAEVIPIHPQPAAPPIHQESCAVLTSAKRKPSTLLSAVACPSQLIQELGERVEEGLWISVQPQGSRLSRSSAQGEAERDCSQPATATDTARTGTFLELSPRRNPLLIVKTDTGDDLDEDDIDEEDY